MTQPTPAPREPRSFDRDSRKDEQKPDNEPDDHFMGRRGDPAEGRRPDEAR